MVNMKFTNNKHEFSEAMNYFFSKTQKRNFDIGLGIIISLVSILHIFFFGFSIEFISFFFIGVFFIIFSLFKGNVVAMVQFKRNKQFNKEYMLSFDDKGIHFITDSVKSDIMWDYYNKAWENKKFFYLFYGKELFTLIPKRAVVTEGELKELRDLIKMNIKEYIDLQ